MKIGEEPKGKPTVTLINRSFGTEIIAKLELNIVLFYSLRAMQFYCSMFFKSLNIIFLMWWCLRYWRKHKVHNEKKAPVVTKDTTNKVLEKETVHGMDDEATWQSDELQSTTHSNTRNTRIKDSSKTKTTPSKPLKRSRRKKSKHSSK